MRLNAIFLLCLLAPMAYGQVMINEFLYDTIGRDDSTLMFTEIFGPPGTELDGWSLVGINGNGGAVYRTVTLEGAIPDNGYFVIGNRPQVENVDQVLNVNSDAGIDWQNAGSSSGDDCDGVELRNSEGTVVDKICYGTCSAGHVCNGEGSNAPDPFPSGGVNFGLARIPDHSDTDNNAVDWVISDLLTPGEPNNGEPCDPIDAALEDLRENDDNGVPVLNGEFVVVRGIVNVNNGVLDDSTSNFFVQDDNAGVNVFGGTVPQGLMEGDCVEVSGWISLFEGLTEIISFGNGNCLFDVEPLESEGELTPLVLTCTSFFEAFEGMLAEIRNVTIVDGSWPPQGQNATLTLTDGNGTILLRIDRDTQVWSAGQPSAAFTVRGIITQFDNTSPHTEGYQITPRYASDIITGSAVGDAPLEAPTSFSLVNSYPNPFNGVTNLEFSVGTARDIHVTITDVLGREVYTRALSNLTPGTHRLQWSPQGAAGLYFVRASSGATLHTTKLLYLK